MKARACKECSHWNDTGLLNPDECQCDKEHYPRFYAIDGYKRKCSDFAPIVGADGTAK